MVVDEPNGNSYLFIYIFTVLMVHKLMFSTFVCVGPNVHIKNTEIFNQLNHLEQPTNFNHRLGVHILNQTEPLEYL